VLAESRIRLSLFDLGVDLESERTLQIAKGMQKSPLRSQMLTQETLEITNQINLIVNWEFS
jgi:hypothetical protein